MQSGFMGTQIVETKFGKLIPWMGDESVVYFDAVHGSSDGSMYIDGESYDAEALRWLASVALKRRVRKVAVAPCFPDAVAARHPEVKVIGYGEEVSWVFVEQREDHVWVNTCTDSEYTR